MSDPTLVQTTRGAVRGRELSGGGLLFGGVPYAQPPDGDLRYREPVPPEPWTGELDATNVGAPAPQPTRALPGLDTEPLLGHAATEPTLTVDVWTPGVEVPDGPGAPVMVWVHGGAFVAGSPGQPIYDGSAFVRDGVVVVGLGHRLGIEGYGRLDGGVANLALHDVLAGLAWVRDEIAAFGGDPDNVTLAGQSAGGFAISWLLGTPRSRGLFHRAIVMSAGCDLSLTPAQADLAARHLAGRLDVEPTAEAFRTVPVADVIAAQGAVQPGEIDLSATGDPAPSGITWLGGVRDGDLVALDPLAAIGEGPDVDLLCGSTAEEGNLYLAGRPDSADGWDPDAHAPITEAVFAGPVRRLRERHAELGGGGAAGRTFGYRFDWRSTAAGGRLGAAHAIDVPFCFETLDAPGLAGSDSALLGPDGGDPALARRMHAAWVDFVRHGDPGFAAHPHLEVFA